MKGPDLSCPPTAVEGLQIHVRALEEKIAVLERQVNDLEFALTAAAAIAEAGLEVSRSIAAERPDDFPRANELNVKPDADARQEPSPTASEGER